MTVFSGDPAYQAALDWVFQPADILTGLNILADGIEHALRNGTDTGVTVASGATQEGHVIGIEMQDIGKRERLIMQGIDVTAELAACPAHPRTQSQPACSAQDGNRPGDG